VTPDELRKRLEEMGASPKKSLGQNFLISDNVVQKIITAARDSHATALVEIGPGPGSLTEHLCTLKVPLRLVELDRQFSQYWRDRNIDVIEGDALKVDWTSLVTANSGTVLVSNLPYQISASLVVEISIHAPVFESMILMFQKEVAQRIRAPEDSDHYGFLSVIAQSFWALQTVCDAGPRDFFPPPKVASRVLQFARRSQSSGAEADGLGQSLHFKNRPAFLKFVKGAFSQRRKQMAKILLHHGLFANVAALEKAWGSVGLRPDARAEQLSVAQFHELFRWSQELRPRHNGVE
jgi:16S rRNA (adenine1518-N6/adenine1519-N6)-dimethyltransferase